MEEQNNALPPHNAKGQSSETTKNEEKFKYLPPTLGTIEVELESNIAAGSISVTQENQEVEEGWMEDDIVRDIEIDLY